MGNFGSVAYMEPKRILDPKFPYTKSSDIYSFGVLMWEISSGYPPFKEIISNNDKYALAVAINAGTREVVIPDTPNEYKELYENCWNKIPEERPTMSKILDEFARMGFGTNINKLIRANGMYDLFFIVLYFYIILFIRIKLQMIQKVRKTKRM